MRKQLIALGTIISTFFGMLSTQSPLFAINYVHGGCTDCDCEAYPSSVTPPPNPCVGSPCCPSGSCSPCQSPCDGPCSSSSCQSPCGDPCSPCAAPVCEPCAPCNPCNPCNPCASACGTDCGISCVAIGVGIAAVAAAGAIIIASGSGHNAH